MYMESDSSSDSIGKELSLVEKKMMQVDLCDENKTSMELYDENKKALETYDKINILKEKIVVLPFQNQLYIMASLPHRDFIKWSSDGLSIQLDCIPLDSHLRSLESMFQTKDCHEFIQTLIDHDFVLVGNNETGELLQFSHQYFVRDRMEYLCRICNSAKNHTPDKRTLDRMKFDASFRMNGDLCIIKHSSLTSIQKSRAEFKTDLEYKSARDLLKSNSAKRTSYGIPLPVKLYKSPMLTVLAVDKNVENYMGYYGDPETDLLDKFIGDKKPLFHLPENMGNEIDYYASYSAAYDMPWLQQKRFTPRNSVKNQTKNSGKQWNQSDGQTNELIPDFTNNYGTVDPEAISWGSGNDDLPFMGTSESMPDDQNTKDEIFANNHEYSQSLEERDLESEIEGDEPETFDAEHNWSSENEYLESQAQRLDSLPDLDNLFPY